jgi:GTP cyclohydrolase I
MADAMDSFLRAAGFDPSGDDHLGQTGRRVAEAWASDLLEGYAVDPREALGAPFVEANRDLVMVKDLEFFSSCPHHLMPYQGRALVAYVPDGLAVGFSGVVRLLDALAHRLTLQEWLTRDVAATLMDVLRPRGAACIVDATPMCVFARGVRRPCRIESTTFLGVFEDDPALRRDLMAAAGRG